MDYNNSITTKRKSDRYLNDHWVMIAMCDFKDHFKVNLSRD